MRGLRPPTDHPLPLSPTHSPLPTAPLIPPLFFHRAGDSLPAITLPTLAEVQSFLASPEVKQVQSWIAEAPPLPKPSAPEPPPKREPKAKPAPHRPPHSRGAEAAQAAEDAPAPVEGGAQPAQPEQAKP